MALNARKAPKASGGSGKAPEPIEPGTYPGRVVQVIDLGLQEQRPYQGQEKPPAYSMFVTYELTGQFMKDEDGNEDESKPRWLSEEFPLHNIEADLAKSTKRYKAIDPKMEHDGDWTQLVGSAANIEVNQYEKKSDGSTRNAVKNVLTMRPRDAAKQPDLVNPSKVFELDDPNMEVFESLPEWLQNKIKANLEFEGSELDKLLNGGKKKTKKPAPEPEPEEEQEGDEGDDDEDLPWDD